MSRHTRIKCWVVSTHFIVSHMDISVTDSTKLDIKFHIIVSSDVTPDGDLLKGSLLRLFSDGSCFVQPESRSHFGRKLDFEVVFVLALQGQLIYCAVLRLALNTAEFFLLKSKRILLLKLIICRSENIRPSISLA